MSSRRATSLPGLARDLGAVLHRTVRDGAAHEAGVVPGVLRRAVLDELAAGAFVPLPPVEGPFGVRQEGEHLVLTGAEIDRWPAVRSLHAAVVAAVHEHTAEIDGLAEWHPDEITVQRYLPGSSGISVHRDGRRHRGLVAILTLEGSARLRQCSDREGTTVRSFDADAGSLVVLRGPGLAGVEDDRPLHAVDGPSGHPRTSFTLRVARPTPG
ncbi:hypothetical protein [Actinomycetospora atypica]|uniref:Fe2OG dioxygenase domain-containing protein n=1 Tax=Actinomycetospora atypica TaxID=1290095 RepID=A0ABV9YMX0_9PSEU